MQFRRLFHAFPEAPELAARNIIRGAPNISARTPTKPEFVVKGLGSVLEVQLPPSVELIAKRNSLVGVLGINAVANSLASRIQLASSPLASWMGRQPLLLQNIVGSSPLTCLLGAENQFINAVELDGSIEWAVRSPILARAGKQLSVSPRHGWSLRAAAPFHHSVITGRGLLAWTTPASTVQIAVPEGETVLVHKQHLSAFTIDTNAAYRPAALAQVDFQFRPLRPTEAPVPVPNASLWYRWRGAAGEIWRQLKSYLDRIMRAGNSGHFVEIRGPSTVLVSSAAKPMRRASPRGSVEPSVK